MKPGVSTLNPYAAAYVPLSKRKACDGTGPTTNDSETGFETDWYVHPAHVTQNQHQSKVSLASVAQGVENGPIPEQSSVRNHPVHGQYGSSSSKQIMDEEYDMDLAYLQMTFPGLSDQSLADVYMANKLDLEATVDMLTQLEGDHFVFNLLQCFKELRKCPCFMGSLTRFIPKAVFEAVESSENLPESLDIGDVPESGTSSESASLNLKSVVGEASSSSSGSSAVVS
ncbi:polyadenylate-binding protein-interacting protein 6-like isoform X1 [Mangifera indica]|uniref:polyadenylate-binding protein-interacting protein 6-like isoform X1 n=1 Tax=Mangifera indica TaxID=29780 RepID=UPI001CF9FEAB|nr:polyadenylate-binding protein-interacting protein 6-like isoform X1 [Mangifera indica]XP_044463918.1 polyadenylate-binding protein-interacting protein 6-like isoform X1 [Mangifera indica]